MKCHPAAKAADYLERGWWSAETIDDLLRARVADTPQRLALIDPPNTRDLVGVEPARCSWVELDQRVEATAATLAQEGVGPGGVVAVQLPNCSALVCTMLAIIRLGAIVTPFPMSYREHEITAMCTRTNAVVAVVGGSTETRFGAVEVRPLVWGRDLPGSASMAPRYSAEPNDCATICWTSGTETEPKAVPRCHGDWLVIAEAIRHSAELGPADVLLSPFPMTNMAGISGMFLPWLQVGGVFVPHHPFDLSVFLQQIAEERATYTVAPPALLTTLLHNEELLSTTDISSLRLIGSGSAPLAAWVVAEWERRHGVGITNFFGSNEGVGLISDLSDVPDPDRRASVFPNYGAANVCWQNPIAERTSVRLADEQTGELVTEPGSVGELRVAGPSVFAGYLSAEPDAALDRSAFDEHGFYRSGDIFELVGEHGEFLRYVDRSKDLVVRGGMNISPAALESMLGAHPAVADVAVIGVPDDVLGERVCAVIVPAGEPPTLADLVAFLETKKIASYRLPERMEVVDVLPRNPVGKVLKRDLREQFGLAAQTTGTKP